MNNIKTTKKLLLQTKAGQSMVEYALILVMLMGAFIMAWTLAGPAIGNMFNDTVYDLLGHTPDLRLEAKPDDFWLLVTQIRANPPGGESTLPPSGSTPLPGVDAPVSDEEMTAWLTGTNEPNPTDVPLPTSTPEDQAFTAPHLENVSSIENWRVSSEPSLGTEDWFGVYYSGKDLDYTGTRPATGGWNRDIYGPSAHGVLNFPDTSYVAWTDQNTGPISDWPSSTPYDNFSVRFRREVSLAEAATIRFSARYSDGVRVWLLSSGQSATSCSATGVTSGSPWSATYDDTTWPNGSAHETDCLLIDDWEDQFSGSSVLRTVPAGDYIIQVDYYDSTGNAELSLDFSIVDNPDDTTVDSSGNATADSTNCGWEQHEYYGNANSMNYDWQSYQNNALPQGMRCYLEFRGYVTVPTTMIDPEFVFWDLWQLDDNQTLGWLEIAIYEPTVPPNGMVLDRAAVSWTKVDLHQGNSMNYNWTRNVIDMSSYKGEKVTFRFVMENRGSIATRRWYIDDIEFLNNNETPLAFVMDEYWSLDTPPVGTLSQAHADFLTSGQWQLTGNKVVTGYSWDIQNDYDRYSRHTESPADVIDVNAFTNEKVRVHYIEFNGAISRDALLVDSDGDSGDAILSFTHAYKIGRYTGLEVQYSVDNGVSWLTVPGLDLSEDGAIEPVTNSDPNTYRETQDLIPMNISLESIPQSTFRLRFAMIVHAQADRRYGGWWIDDIKLHRRDPQMYSDYPFLDDAEAGIDNWLPSGTWARTNLVAMTNEFDADGTRHSFTDSPGALYNTNTNTSLLLENPIDMNNDTPGNLILMDRNPGIGGNSGGAAVSPRLTFYHLRQLHGNDAIYVEWRRMQELDSEWKPLWAYVYGMNTASSSTSSRTSMQNAWEFVELDLSTITYDTLDADLEDDDIFIRFRLYSDGVNTRDGVYIDNIVLDEYTETSFMLWPDDSDRTIDGTAYGVGDGINYTADVDESNWDDRWQAGGSWRAISWEQRQGLQSWHESPDSQTTAPVYGVAPTDSNSWQNTTKTPIDSFNVLEMTSVIDLRATYASEEPTLYFWTRYHMGASERISVQISEELDATADLDADMAARCKNSAMSQCYEQLRGWGEWTTVGFDLSANYSSIYSWQRMQVPLDSYTAPDANTPGSRVRIRFIYDTLDNSLSSSSRDGWYIDNVSIEPRRDGVLKTISTARFYDPARNMDNWVGEGDWGLSPEFYRGIGGGPADLGTWHESFWDCSECPTIGDDAGSTLSKQMRVGADMFLDVDGAASSLGAYTDITPVTQTVAVISYDIFDAAPRPGDFDFTDYFVGRWVMNTPVIGTGIAAGDYTFITVSDDGVRVKSELIDSSGNPVNPVPPNAIDEWNIIYNWTDHGRTGDIGKVNLIDGLRYRFTVEWYDNVDDAVLIVTVGNSSFSFTDSPKQGAGVAFMDIPTIANSNSSLILDGSLDLTGTADPVLEYYTLYELRRYANVEVSIDGGFTWTSAGLGDPHPTVVINQPTWGDSYYLADWKYHRHNLKDYIGETVMIRFRMNNDGYSDIDLITNSTYVSWWVVDIVVRDLSGPIGPVCGDGNIDAGEGEICDDGINNGVYTPIAPGYCNASCTGPGSFCGDGICNIGLGETPAVCGSDCSCGNGVLDAGEICDDGANNGVYTAAAPGYCNVMCDGYGSYCGDSTCDDGDGEDFVSCLTDCPAPICGDGTVDAGEVCDDGNTTDGDGCNSTCTVVDHCAGITLSSYVFYDFAKQVRFEVHNNSGGTITLTGVELTWDPAGNKAGALTSISLASSLIYNTWNATGSLDIPDVSSWIGGVNRDIANTQLPQIMYQFVDGAKNGSEVGSSNLTFYNSVNSGSCTLTAN